MELKKLRILHIITKLELGGAQKNVLDIVSHLDRNRYAIYLVSADKGLLANEAQNIPGIKTILLPSVTRPINPLTDLITLLKLTFLFKQESISIVHTHSSKAGILGRWAARLSGVPIIVHTIHGWSFHNYLKFFTKSFYTSLERLTAKFTDRLITVSRSDIRKGLDNFIGARDKYTFIPYGINREEFLNCHIDIARKKRELGLNVDSVVVGMVACFKPQKAPCDFVRVASLVIERNPKTQFLLVGEGVLRRRLERLIANFNLEENFILTGWRQDIPEILSCLDVLALTSLWEGSPRVFLEAMCRKLPIVAYNVDGVSEVIKEGVNGFLVKPKDFAGMAEKINRLLDNQDLRKTMGMRGFDMVMNNGYQVERMLKDLDALYCNLSLQLSA